MQRKKIAIILIFFIMIGILTFLALQVVTAPIFDTPLSSDNENDALQSVQELVSFDPLQLEQKSALTMPIYTENIKAPLPTNKWYSSVVFTKASEPLFAYPLAIKMTTEGYGVSFPNIVSTPDTVFGSYDPDFQVIFQTPALDSLLASSDELSVAITQKALGNEVSQLRVTQGSPYIFATASAHQHFAIHSNNIQVLQKGEDFIEFRAHGKRYALFYDPKTINVQDIVGQEASKNASQGTEQGFEITTSNAPSSYSLVVLPADAQVSNAQSNNAQLELFREFAFNPIVGTKVSFDTVKNDDMQTDPSVHSQFEIMTKNGGDTLYALPSKRVSALKQFESYTAITSYPTLLGDLQLYKGNSFEFVRTVPDMPSQLHIEMLSETEKNVLREMVKKDASAMTITEEDTYFLGKKLYALANLLDLSKQLQMSEESVRLQTMLSKELNLWRENSLSQGQTKKYFYYDNVVKGIVGETASFGSELFNDHAFHYGYFIYAASILSRYDTQYLEENEVFINMLVKDIANTKRADDAFPYLRGFDAYTGHSNAGGLSLFGDGNNQESSSEAVNAWYALYLWGQVIDNASLQETAQYLFSEESSTALHDYLNIDRNTSRFENFKHAFVSLIWGGKFDSATWFSPRPEARLGIQIIPVNPASVYLGQDKNRVQENLQSEAEFSQPTMFKDFLALYGALYDAPSALEKITALKNDEIDSSNTRSFMRAWILTLPHNNLRNELPN